MKTKQFFLFFLLATIGVSWGQTAQSLPYTMSDAAGISSLTTANGWVYSGIGSDYSSSGSNIKFASTGVFAQGIRF